MSTLATIFAIIASFSIDGNTISTTVEGLESIEIVETKHISASKDLQITVFKCEEAITCMEVKRQGQHRLYVYQGRTRIVIDN